MSTKAQILNACDRAMLDAIGRGQASQEVRDAFRMQLANGATAPLQGAQIETQTDFTQAGPVENRTGQTLLF